MSQDDLDASESAEGICRRDQCLARSAYYVMSYQPLPTNEHNATTRVKRFPNDGFLAISGGKPCYAYGAPGLLGLYRNKYALACAFFVSIGGLTFGYDQGVVANILVMKDFRWQFSASPYQEGLLTALLEFGALAGALVTGSKAETSPRRQIIGFACVVFCVGSFVQTAASSLSTLGLGRFIGGIGIGSLSTLCPLYMSEISPPEMRGTILSIEQLSIVLGVVIGFWFGFFTRTIPGSWSWRLPLAVQLIPGAILAIGTLMLPESPRYLVAAGDDDEAVRVLRELRNASHGGNEELIQIELLEMRVDTTFNRKSLEQGTYKPEGQTLLGIVVMFFQQFSGINAILYFGPHLMASLGLTGDTIILISSGFVNIMQFVAVTPAIIFIDRLGRRPLLMDTAGSLVMGAAHGTIAILVWYGKDDWPSNQALAWCAVAMIYVFTAGYGMSFGPVAWVLPNEIFPLTVRSHGVGLSTASNWFNNFIIGLISPTLIAVSPVATFLLFASSCVAAFFWSLYVVPETRGVSLEEMGALFEGDDGMDSAKAKEEVEVSLGLPQLVQRILDS